MIESHLERAKKGQRDQLNRGDAQERLLSPGAAETSITCAADSFSSIHGGLILQG